MNKNKKLTRLSLDKSTVRQLSGPAFKLVAGGISNRPGCNYTIWDCDPTFDTCPDTVSGADNCHTGGWSHCGC
jgi:hypothetical protein